MLSTATLVDLFRKKKPFSLFLFPDSYKAADTLWSSGMTLLGHTPFERHLEDFQHNYKTQVTCINNQIKAYCSTDNSGPLYKG